MEARLPAGFFYAAAADLSSICNRDQNFCDLSLFYCLYIDFNANCGHDPAYRIYQTLFSLPGNNKNTPDRNPGTTTNRGTIMMLNPKKQALALAVAIGMALPGSALATNGYFSHGYGHKSKGMAGTGVAKSLDSMDAVLNPANMVNAGNRIDLGVALFSQQRSYTVEQVGPFLGPETGAFSLVPGTFDSDNELFAIPNFGWNMMIDDVSSFGVSVAGNGGMNSEYKDVTTPTPAGPFEIGTYGAGQVPGADPVAGVDLMQLVVAPTYARKINDNAQWGATLLLAAARFKATGLATFGGFSTDPAALTDNGYETVFGAGVKLGISGEVAPGLSLGASWQSKVSMSEMDKYAGLFAEQGAFDIPQTWTLGAAWDVNDQNTLLFDVQWINYSDIPSLNNPMLPNLFQCFGGDPNSCLGGDNGPGFGWENITVYKLGYQYDAGPWQARAGFSTNDQPIPDSEVMFNILAPGVVEDHWTAGFSMDVGKNSGLDFSFMYAPTVKVKGANPLAAHPSVGNTQNIEIQMKQYEFGVNYSWRY
jgi:long-chain fatty acid transport protein